MKNKTITRKITQGMYVLTTIGGGCIVDSVSQISAGENPLIAVSVMKENYTNQLLSKNSRFILSVLGLDVDFEIIKVFGMNSMRDINKFELIKTNDIDGISVVNDSLGYMECEIIDSIENDTHTLFIGKLIEADVFLDEEAMSYNYYQKHKDELIKIDTENKKTAWICNVCGYIYYGDVLPDDFVCPKCFVSSDNFTKQEIKK